MSFNFVFIFRLLIAISFIVFAIVLMLFRQYVELSDFQVYGFSALLIIYGFFRVYRAFKSKDVN